MPETPTASDNSRAPDAWELRSLEIDIELRDIWQAIDQRRDLFDDLQLEITARAMRAAFERGRLLGEAASEDAGYEEGYIQGYDDGCAEGAEQGYAAAPE